MYIPRKIESSVLWTDPDGIKIYTISAHNSNVEQSNFLDRLNQVKKTRKISWINTPAFSIFHDGIHFPYLILGWWSNDNELFTSVSVFTEKGWQENHQLYSFCVYDLEIFWAERNIFIETIDCEIPNIVNYRNTRYTP